MKYCQHCNQEVEPKKSVNFLILLIMTFLTGGAWLIVYVLYYAYFKKGTCPICQSEDLIDVVQSSRKPAAPGITAQKPANKAIVKHSSTGEVKRIDLKKYVKTIPELSPEEVYFFDTETTGFSPKDDEILQLAIVDNNGTVVYDSYFKPARKTQWRSAQKVNNISPAMVKNCPSLESEKETIQGIFEKAKLLYAYNASFDTNFLLAAGIDVRNKTIDALSKARGISGLPNYKLDTVAHALDYDFIAHNAAADAQATRFIINKCSNTKDDYLLKLRETNSAKEDKERAEQDNIDTSELLFDDIKNLALKINSSPSYRYRGYNYSAFKQWKSFETAIQQGNIENEVNSKQATENTKQVFIIGLFEQTETLKKFLAQDVITNTRLSGKIDYVLIGDFDYVDIREKSAKELEKAEMLKVKSPSLQILYEDEIASSKVSLDN